MVQSTKIDMPRFAVLDLLRQRRSRGLVVLMTVAALCDMMGLATVMPFLAVLADPTMIERWPWLAWAYAAGDFETAREFLFGLGAIAFGVLLGSAILRSYALYRQFAFVQHLRTHWASRLIRHFADFSYQTFLGRQNTKMIATVLSELDHVIDKVVMPSVLLLSALASTIAITMLLIAIDLGLALSAFGVLAVLFAAVHAATRGAFAKLGEMRLQANRERFGTADELFHGFKVIHLSDRTAHYTARFDRASKAYADSIARTAVLSQMPRYGVELLTFGTLVGVALILSSRSGADGIGQILPMLGLYALAGYRLLPTLQALFLNASELRAGQAFAEALHADLSQALHSPTASAAPQEAVRFEETLGLHAARFSFPGRQSAELAEIDLVLRKGTSFGIVGPTGAGKSTIADMLMGLLPLHGGSLCLDGVALSPAQVRGWHRKIGYVPQSIYLSGGTIAQNIALGIDPAHIDMDRVKRCAHQALIKDFVINDLPMGFETTVGDNGSHLSGGQRQRIGIARALYSDPDVLVFDEASAALDVETETKLLNSLRALAGPKTFVHIAHRLATVQKCDQIAVIEQGRITAIGDLATLQSNNAFVKSMR